MGKCLSLSDFLLVEAKKQNNTQINMNIDNMKCLLGCGNEQTYS